eukprot:COSAG06_NODE_1100_length_10710_cov_9.583168_11_plen_209_part_00
MLSQPAAACQCETLNADGWLAGSLCSLGARTDIFPNGSALLIYKSGRAAGWPSMYMGVAFAEHYTGPYRRLTPDKPLVIRKQSADCEDPGIYFDHGFNVFRMVLHCGCGTQMLWSETGVEWELGGAVQATGWCSGFNWTDGSGAGKLATRQRPHFVLDQVGRATHLTTGVNRPGDSAMGHTYTMAAKLLRQEHRAGSSAAASKNAVLS